MKTNKPIQVLLTAALGALSLPGVVVAAESVTGTTISGEVTPKFYYFDYFKGSDSNSTQFLERYNYQRGWGDDNRGGAYLDADFNIVARNDQREVFSLEREGFGSYNQRGKLKADGDVWGVTGYYSNFRTSTGGLSYLYSPNQVPGGTDSTYYFPAATNTNSGYVAQFNDDTGGQRQYSVDRTTYGLGFKLKPTLFGSDGSYAAINYDGYQRDGNRLASYVAGGSDVTGANARVLERWRGYNQAIEENMNRLRLNVGAAPGGFSVAYEGMLEKFDNTARNNLMGDFATGFSGFLAAGSVNKPLHFVPDSTLMSNNLRLAKTFGATAVAAGYGLSVLSQDSFTANQQALGYNTGKITTNNAYLSVNTAVVPGVGLEGFVKYYQRDNDSDFPVVGLINADGNQQLGVRINRIETLSYGAAATFRPGFLKSSATVGWKHEDKDRDLTWSTAAAGGSIQPQRSLYRDLTRSDELYLNWIARPLQGVVLRVSPSYVLADKTGLVTEPEESFQLKTKLSYTTSLGMMVSGYYNFKNIQNANNALYNNIANNVATTGITQNVDKTLHSAGLTLNLPVSEWINTTASLAWMQNDFSTYYLSSDRRRFEPGIANATTLNFLLRDNANYTVDSYVATLGADWQVSDPLRLNAGYTFTKSTGHTADGLIGAQLGTIDDTIDNTLHSVAFGADYAVKKSYKLRASYVYDYYTDRAYSALTGGYHTLMVGLSVGF
jgi:hypothetical protein